MKWSYRIGRWWGIDVYLHSSFGLLLLWVAWQHLAAGDGLGQTLLGLLFTLLLFGCVLLHEYGHALTARRFGIATADITLLPVGGVARLERIPREPWQELLVALAGPAVNVVIAAALLGWLVLTATWQPFGELGVVSGNLAERLFVVNLALIVFNLLPAFPMDGGRVLRALLALRLEYPRATLIAARAGQAMALLFVLAGLLGLSSPFLMAIGVVVWIGARTELHDVRRRTSGLLVHRAMLPEFTVVRPGMTLQETLLAAQQWPDRDLPVVHEGRVVGLLAHPALAAAVARGGGAELVQEHCSERLVAVHPADLLDDVQPYLAATGSATALVVYQGRLLGLLPAARLREFLAAARR
ncbi:MAG: site-2 protease family protein [Fimbriimonadaceae bacterium]|nr:site-2 protease family protein [Fimbriimonadaceae bacterium]